MLPNKIEMKENKHKLKKLHTKTQLEIKIKMAKIAIYNI